ncbi:hypothetical protein [Streptomyces sp. CC224B]|nr:hypothetical protein [Streptomyces sp. CC224B]
MPEGAADVLLPFLATRQTVRAAVRLLPSARRRLSLGDGCGCG